MCRQIRTIIWAPTPLLGGYIEWTCAYPRCMLGEIWLYYFTHAYVHVHINFHTYTHMHMHNIHIYKHICIHVHVYTLPLSYAPVKAETLSTHPVRLGLTAAKIFAHPPNQSWVRVPVCLSICFCCNKVSLAIYRGCVCSVLIALTCSSLTMYCVCMCVCVCSVVFGCVWMFLISKPSASVYAGVLERMFVHHKLNASAFFRGIW